MRRGNLAIQRQARAAKSRKLIFVWAMLALPILHFLVFFVYVNLDSIILSFTDASGNFTWFQYKEFFTELFQGNELSGYTYRNAIIYSFLLGLNDALLVFISTILAYFLYRKIPGSNIFRFIFFLPSIISITIYVLVFRFMMSPTTGFPGRIIPDWGWLNDGTIANKFVIPIYCIWVGTGYNILILGGAMSNIPTEVIENAKLEGVGMWRELFDIIIPMIWPTLSVAYLGSVAVIFSLFLQVQLITEGSTGTLTIAYIINSSTTNNQYNYAAAMGIVFTIVSIPMVLLAKKLMDHMGKKWGYQ